MRKSAATPPLCHRSPRLPRAGGALCVERLRNPTSWKRSPKTQPESAGRARVEERGNTPRVFATAQRIIGHSPADSPFVDRFTNFRPRPRRWPRRSPSAIKPLGGDRRSKFTQRIPAEFRNKRENKKTRQAEHSATEREWRARNKFKLPDAGLQTIHPAQSH